MIKIGVVSDTHIPKRAKFLPKELINGLQGVDCIIHAGDWQSLEVYKELSKIAPVNGVAGNVDSEEIVKKFGRKKKLTIGRFNIGVIHGDGIRMTTEKRVIEAFKDDPVDLIIFGHSHIPLYKKSGDVWLFNPGSPTDKRRQEQYSFGIILLGAQINATHVYYSNKS
jgi:putative phosphoesterase